MIGELNFSVDNAALLHALTGNDLRFAPLTAGQLAARMMFGSGGSSGGTYGASQPLLNAKDPSKHGPPPSSGMSTTTMAAIGVGVLAAGLIGYKLLKKR
jgi:hypothetical protein